MSGPCPACGFLDDKPDREPPCPNCKGTGTPLFSVVSSFPGYAHSTVQGLCDPSVTAEDVRRRFYHWYFGGRNAWARDGMFGVIVHTD